MSKQIIGIDVGTYVFNKTAKTITIGGLDQDLLLEQVLLITNVTSQNIIYQFNATGKGGSIASNVLTLDFDTSAMNDADDLQIFIQLSDDEYRQKVDSRPAREFGAVSAYGLPKFSLERILKQYKFSDALLQINFIGSNSGNGTVTTDDPFIVNLTSGTTSSSTNTITTKQSHIHPVGKGLILKMFTKHDNISVTGNRRCFGLYNNSDGFFIELSEGTLKFVTRKLGVDTFYEASTWDVPVLPNVNNNLWYVQSEGAGVGDFELWYNEKLVHRIVNLGVVSTTVMNETDLPLRIENTNSSNTTDVLLAIDGAMVATEGEESVVVTDGVREILLNSSRRLLIQGSGSPLMAEPFDKPLDTINRWLPTVVGGSTWTQPANTYTLFLSSSQGATDLVDLTFRENNLRETVGGFAEFEVGAKFGSDLVVGNRREWGYKDDPALNGVFFRVDGPDLYFVNLKGGVESVTSLASNIPNNNFHLYRIEHLGAGKISGYIDGIQVVDFAPAATSQVGAAEKKPFVKMYNTAALSSVPSDCEFHWIRLLDQSGTRVSMVGIDDNNQIRTVKVNSSGELRVAASTPTNINYEVEVNQSVSGTIVVFQDILNNNNLELKSLAANADESNAGIFVTIEEDVNGNDTVINFITRVTIPTSGGTIPIQGLTDNIIGTATNRVKLTVQQSGGGASTVLVELKGTETPI